MKFDKPVKMSYPDYAKAIDHFAPLARTEICEAEAKSFYRQVYHLPFAAFCRACEWYVYHCKEKYPNSMLQVLRTKTYELAGDFSDVMPTGISVKVTAEQLRLDAEYRQKAKALLPPPRGRPKSAKELAEGMGIPQGLPSPAELQAKADEQRRKLLERMK